MKLSRLQKQDIKDKAALAADQLYERADFLPETRFKAQFRETLGNAMKFFDLAVDQDPPEEVEEGVEEGVDA